MGSPGTCTQHKQRLVNTANQQAGVRRVTHRPRPLPRVALGVMFVRYKRHRRVETALEGAAGRAGAHELGSIVPHVSAAKCYVFSR